MPLRFLVLAFALIALPPLQAAAPTWTPPTPEELAQTDSTVEPGAGAEILSFHVSIDDSEGLITEYKQHMRAKIFTQKGVEDFLSHKIFYEDDTTVRKIEARTYKPDGTTVILDKKAILDQQIVRINNLKARAKVLALPGLEPGCIIELRWSVDRESAFAFPLEFQFEHPARRISYEFARSEYFGLQSLTVNYTGPAPSIDKNGRYHLEMTDVKGYREEPYDLPSRQAKSWMLIWYTNDRSETIGEFWANYCRRLHDQREERAKPRRDIVAAAKKITEGAATPDEKLRRLYEHCITQIKNKYFGYAGYTASERTKLKKNESPSDTLKNGYGTGLDINYLFIALARAVDLDVRLAMTSDRDGFAPHLGNRHDIVLLTTLAAFQKSDGQWLFFDPGSIFLPYGMLRPENEGVTALISDPKKDLSTSTPKNPPGASAKKRTGLFILDAEGTLTGDVTMEYTGMTSFEVKYDLEDETIEEQQEIIRKEVLGKLPLAEVTDIKVEGARSPTQPLKITYKLRVPQYADRTGQRLLLQPAVFQKNASPFFTAETRINKISFRRNQSTQDHIRIALPPNFKIEEGSSPASNAMGGIGQYKVVLGLTKSGTTLVYRRQLDQNFVIIGPENYPQIKKMFEDIHAADNHTVSLLEVTPAATDSNPPAPAAP